VVAIAALVYTNQASDNTFKNTREQLRLAERAQTADRFNKAIDQLAQIQLDLRLSGIYGLGRIMQVSVGDEPLIIEILCSFIREHSPYSSANAKSHLWNSPSDVRDAVIVLGRRPAPGNADNQRLDLSGSLLSLPNADLSDVNLIGAALTHANLSGTVLDRVGLQYTDLGGADLHFARLGGADLHYANLSGADLHGTDLAGARMEDTNLKGAHLEGADLSGADLSGADLSGAHLDGVRTDSYTKLPSGVVIPFATPSPGPS
jgi:hypothetical protein